FEPGNIRQAQIEDDAVEFLRVQRVPRLGSASRRCDLDTRIVEQLHDTLALDLVVLDDQQAAVAGLSVIENSIEGLLQFIRGCRLDQVIEGTVPQSLHALVFNADDLHRNMAGGGILLQVIQDSPSQHVRQEDIQHDRQWIELAGQRTRVTPVGGDHAFKSLAAHHVQQDLTEMGIVLDNQHNRI